MLEEEGKHIRKREKQTKIILIGAVCACLIIVH